MTQLDPTGAPGFNSPASKRALSRATWAGAVVIGLLQLVVPVVLILWGVYIAIVGAFTTPAPEVEAPAVAGADILYTAPVREEGENVFSSPERRQLLRVPLGSEDAPQVLAEIEGDADDPMLLAVGDEVFAIDDNAVSVYADGDVRRIEVDEPLPYLVWPVVVDGGAAVVTYEADGADDGDLALRTWDGQRWQTQHQQSVAVASSISELRVVHIGETIHVFVGRFDGHVQHATLTAGELSPFVDTKIPAETWTAAAQDGRPVVFELDQSVDPPGIIGWTYGSRWHRVVAEPAPGAMWIGAVGLPDGRVAVTTDATFDGIQVRVFDGEVVVSEHEHSGSNIWSEFIGLIVLSQVAPLLLTGLLAVFLSGRMQAHRPTEYRGGVHQAQYASLLRRAWAKTIDSAIAVSVPLALAIPALMGDGGSLDESWVWGVVLLWGVPLGLAFTALEGTLGWTPGKRLAGIRVVDLELRPPGFGPALTRGLLGAVDGFFSGVVGIVAVATSRHWQRIGDQLAHTLVIRAPEPDQQRRP